MICHDGEKSIGIGMQLSVPLEIARIYAKIRERQLGTKSKTHEMNGIKRLRRKSKKSLKNWII